MKAVVMRWPVAVLVALAVCGMLLQAGSVPHAHADEDVGLYNAEHDLTLLAGLAAHVIPVDAAPTVVLLAVSALLVPYAPDSPTVHVERAGDSRAPPTL